MENRKVTQAQINRFRDSLIGQERSNATIGKYTRDIRAFAAFANGEKVSKEMAVRYKQYLMESFAPASVNSMLAALNSFFKEMGWYDCIVRAIRVQRQSFRSREREMTKAEYFRLLEAAKQRNRHRLYLVMQTICATGIRVSELRFITVEALQAGRATVSLKGKTRQVLLPRDLGRELKRYAREKNILHGSIFVTRTGKPMDRSNILHEMKSLCEAAGVDRSKVFPHNLRHLFACLYYQASKDLSRLADVLGHSSVNTTRIYTSISGAEQQRQIERLGLVVSQKNTA